ncbi:MAG: carbamoyltransferase HypF [Phaeodactylibacter sp.]|nr:carbamoyltransferase HypF [Phaeodactylibacter sp.]
MPTYHIHIEGQVQGVGFRPYVYRMATEAGLSGWVSNTNDGVHIEIEASPEEADIFYHSLVAKAPIMSLILRHSIQEVEEKEFQSFQIVDSREGGEARLLMTPDFAMCDDCRRELPQENNRRYGYPFITCTNCGPRFSIIRRLPYDRERTTMAPFVMCPDCRSEYDNPLDRRYYSQTNSCPACSIQLALYTKDKTLVSSDTGFILQRISRLWEEGKIIAVKGIGGFLLTCDAANAAAVEELRRRKNRPAKPFALMYPDTETLRQDARLAPEAEKLLHSPAAPIVLLPVEEAPPSGIALEPIAPGLGQIGVMLPYAPLYELLLRYFPRPIVATSGNVSGAPICYENEEALNSLSAIADYLLLNNRDIATPQDDSVIRLSPHYGVPVFLRRSRGYAPTLLPPVPSAEKEAVLATGAELKSTFTLLHAGNYYASQYLGALGTLETQERFRETVHHLLSLFEVQPGIIVADKHPGYFSTQLAHEMAKKWNIPVFSYQHHIAHFAALLGEHGLLQAGAPILGIVWDGLGLGDDGQIWGGEFFIYDNYAFRRFSQFEYFNYSLGDKIAREPRLSALMAAQGLEKAEKWLRPKFSKTEWKVYQQLMEREPTIHTSSAGRLFDAAASLLTGRDICTFEGEAAMLLEQLAQRYCRKNGLDMENHYPCINEENGQVSSSSLMNGILESLARGEEREAIAARFHFSLVKAAEAVACRAGVQKLAFSGGVFQNSLLIDLAHHHLGAQYEMFFHRHLSPNDESVSFGQLMCYFIQKEQAKGPQYSP